MRVVFDTNVVASASFWRGAPFECLNAWVQGRCEAVISPPLVSEYHEVMARLLVEYSGQPFVPWADRLTKSALLVFPLDRAIGATTDPDDEMILECALAGAVDYIVSGDKKHLLRLRKFREIPILNPLDFLRLFKN